MILSHKEVLEALEAMKAHSPTIVYPFLFTLAHTGARREEVRLLKWEHHRFRERTHDLQEHQERVGSNHQNGINPYCLPPVSPSYLRLGVYEPVWVAPEPQPDRRNYRDSPAKASLHETVALP